MRGRTIKACKAYFTLDLLAGLAIAALLISLTLPNLAYFSKSLQFRRHSQKVFSGLERLISQAALYRHDITLQFSEREIAASSDNRIIKRIPLGGILKFELQDHDGVVTFYSQGVCTPATLKLLEGNRSCIFSISLRCRIKSDCGL